MSDQINKNNIMAAIGLFCMKAASAYFIMLEKGLNMLVSGLISEEIDESVGI